MVIYKQTVPAFGFTYSYELPEGWTTGKEDDGERWFIVHRSPENSALRFTVTTTAGYRTKWTPNGMPKGLTDPDLRLAFASADMRACLNTDGVSRWFARRLAHGFGWHVRLTDETLGACRGFTYSRGHSGVPGWFGCFVQPPCFFWIDFRPAGKDHAAEIAVVQRIVASFRVEPLGKEATKRMGKT